MALFIHGVARLVERRIETDIHQLCLSNWIVIPFVPIFDAVVAAICAIIFVVVTLGVGGAIVYLHKEGRCSTDVLVLDWGWGQESGGKLNFGSSQLCAWYSLVLCGLWL